jgi:hypothetical protein
MKILLGDLNAKLERDNILKSVVRNESSTCGIREVNFATSEIVIVKSTMFTHHKIHKIY